MEKVAVSTSEVTKEVVAEKPDFRSKKKEKQRSSRRMEDHRASTSQKNDANAKQALYDKLYYGFRQQHEAMKSMQIVTTPRSIILPISTRSVGFMIRFLVCKFARLGIRNVEFHSLCSSLYRVTLLQIEIKLMLSMRNQFSRNIGAKEFGNIDINPDYVRIVSKLGAYFGPLTNLVSAIGVVKAFGAQIIPRMARPSIIEHVRSYDPTLIGFTSLRDYVQALSSSVTPYHVRKYFYDHSPIPNARWRLQDRVRDDILDENFPILSNADDIIPATYSLDDLHSDVNYVMDAVELIGRKYEKFVHVGGIDYSGNGNYTMFPSNDVEDIRCTDLSWIGPNPVYNISNPFSGTIDRFWSFEAISDAEFYFGSIHLLGERLRKEALTGAYSIRHQDVGKQEATIDYTAGLQSLLG